MMRPGTRTSSVRLAGKSTLRISSCIVPGPRRLPALSESSASRISSVSIRVPVLFRKTSECVRRWSLGIHWPSIATGIRTVHHSDGGSEPSPGRCATPHFGSKRRVLPPRSHVGPGSNCNRALQKVSKNYPWRMQETKEAWLGSMTSSIEKSTCIMGRSLPAMTMLAVSC